MLNQKYIKEISSKEILGPIFKYIGLLKVVQELKYLSKFSYLKNFFYCEFCCYLLVQHFEYSGDDCGGWSVNGEIVDVDTQNKT